MFCPDNWSWLVTAFIVVRRSGLGLDRVFDRVDIRRFFKDRIFDGLSGYRVRTQPMFWSIRFHREGPTKGAQEDPASDTFEYVSVGRFVFSIGREWLLRLCQSRVDQVCVQFVTPSYLNGAVRRV